MVDQRRYNNYSFWELKFKVVGSKNLHSLQWNGKITKKKADVSEANKLDRIRNNKN